MAETVPMYEALPLLVMAAFVLAFIGCLIGLWRSSAAAPTKSASDRWHIYYNYDASLHLTRYVVGTGLGLDSAPASMTGWWRVTTEGYDSREAAMEAASQRWLTHQSHIAGCRRYLLTWPTPAVEFFQ